MLKPIVTIEYKTHLGDGVKKFRGKTADERSLTFARSLMRMVDNIRVGSPQWGHIFIKATFKKEN